MDTRDIKEMNKLLSAIGRNINQIAKRVNAGGPTYQADMEEIRERLDQIWQLQRRILLSQTLKAAIDYICNPDKTDGKLLVSSFGCAAETADIEFNWTHRHAIDKGTHLGRHLIQAFEPGEVSPEEAHEIGVQLAKEILGGKYEFVLATHIDKGHIHNHLIFNAVSFTDHKHYHSNKRSYHEIRRVSDRLCREHGLSVIVPGRDKGKSYIEHQAAQNGTSYKAKLKAAIDRLIPVYSSWKICLPSCSGKDTRSSGESISPPGHRIRRGSPDSKPWVLITRKKPLPPASPEAPDPPDSPSSAAGRSACSLTFRTISRPSRAPDTSGGRPLRI